ncbi:hypothetical protein JCM9492_05470 [Aquifex pyrophilus]
MSKELIQLLEDANLITCLEEDDYCTTQDLKEEYIRLIKEEERKEDSYVDFSDTPQD